MKCQRRGKQSVAGEESRDAGIAAVSNNIHRQYLEATAGRWRQRVDEIRAG